MEDGLMHVYDFRDISSPSRTYYLLATSTEDKLASSLEDLNTGDWLELDEASKIYRHIVIYFRKEG